MQCQRLLLIGKCLHCFIARLEHGKADNDVRSAVVESSCPGLGSHSSYHPDMWVLMYENAREDLWMAGLGQAVLRLSRFLVIKQDRFCRCEEISTITLSRVCIYSVAGAFLVPAVVRFQISSEGLRLPGKAQRANQCALPLPLSQSASFCSVGCFCLLKYWFVCLSYL